MTERLSYNTIFSLTGHLTDEGTVEVAASTELGVFAELVEAHLAQCQTCREDVARFKSLVFDIDSETEEGRARIAEGDQLVRAILESESEPKH